MTYFPGNEKFQRNVELTVLVHQFYGRKWYYVMHIILYGSLQSFNIASIISAAQTFDAFLITIFGRTCGFGISPLSGFICASEQTNSNSPFGDNYMLCTAGFLVLLVLVIPLITLNLNDNLIVQLFSLVYLVFVIIVWVIMAFAVGLGSAGMQTFGSNLTGVIGTVMFNYTLANTVPSWMNTKHKSVPIAKTVWWSTWMATALYLIIGIFGGAAFPMPSDSNLIQAIASNVNVSAAGKGVNQAINVTYPVLVLLTSIPVSIIIVKLNLVTSRLCTGSWASFWAAAFPFIAALPFQTGAWITYFSNWSSLIFQSLCNFAAPFLVYLYLPKRNLVMQQSVLDELEFLDIDAGIKKWKDDDDDFDYVYHLPYADLNRLGVQRYNPFAPAATAGSQASLAVGQGAPEQPSTAGGSSSGTSAQQSQYFGAARYGQSVAALSTASGQSAKQLMRQMLGPGGGGSRRRVNKNASKLNSNATSRRTSLTNSRSMSNLGGGLAVPGAGGLAPPSEGARRLSVMLMPGANMNKIHPVTDMDDDVEANSSKAMMNAPAYVEDQTGEMGQFRAIPYWISRRVHPSWIAAVALVLTMVAALAVLILDVMDAAQTGLDLNSNSNSNSSSSDGPVLEVVGDI
ncbi:hypothetical protein SpCBS45565_g01382 [Spizellomyces sp. 'palustris']|nr:hypothetical protein SpCBS45565_g01382 [Spizellomyces sp. 'palustris']